MAKRVSKRTEPLSIRLDPSVRAELDRVTAEENRSLSNYIETVLRRHFDELRKARKQTKE